MAYNIKLDGTTVEGFSIGRPGQANIGLLASGSTSTATSVITLPAGTTQASIQANGGSLTITGPSTGSSASQLRLSASNGINTGDIFFYGASNTLYGASSTLQAGSSTDAWTPGVALQGGNASLISGTAAGAGQAFIQATGGFVQTDGTIGGGDVVITLGPGPDYPGSFSVQTLSFLWRLNGNGSLTLNTSEGTAGQVLTSNGPGAAVSWGAAGQTPRQVSKYTALRAF
jgi:hypothetical protein